MLFNCVLAAWHQHHLPVLTCVVMLSLIVIAVQMAGSLEQQLERKMAFVQELKCLPVAVQTAAANEQHYEVSCRPCST